MPVPSNDHANQSSGEQIGERLLGELRARGIAYLSGGHEAVAAASAHPMSDAELMYALARYPDSRVRNAVIGLLLLHPELAGAIPDALRSSDEPTAQSLATLALAALYMSHLWRTRLRLALGRAPELPADLLAPMIAVRGLPAADEMDGELGLRALEQFEQARRSLPLSFIGDWQNQVDHLLSQELRRQPPEREQATA
ncbi:MAG TPA: hypothetical protein VF116_03665 [Ktedonobacterales bacterium]